MTTPTREQVNKLLEMIQRHFPSLPLSDAYTDWKKWSEFAQAAFSFGASEARADLEATIAEKDAEIAKLNEHLDLQIPKGVLLEQQACIAALHAFLTRIASAQEPWSMEDLKQLLTAQSSTDALREHDTQLVERLSTMTLSAYALKQIAASIREGTFK